MMTTAFTFEVGRAYKTAEGGKKRCIAVDRKDMNMIRINADPGHHHSIVLLDEDTGSVTITTPNGGCSGDPTDVVGYWND